MLGLQNQVEQLHRKEAEKVAKLENKSYLTRTVHVNLAHH